MIHLIKMQGKTIENYKDIGLNGWGDVVLEPVKCEVFKEDNGQYYLSAELPISYSKDINQGDIIIVDLPILEKQCFIINNKFETRRRIYIDNAKHISFLSDFILCTGGLALNPEMLEEKIERFIEGSVLVNKTNIEGAASYVDKFEYARLTDVLETIANTANLHITRDNLQIGLADKIGKDRGLVFKYDKNIKEFKRIENWDNVVTELFYTSSEKGVYEDEKGEKQYHRIWVDHTYPINYSAAKTFSLSALSADEVQRLDDLLNKDAGTKDGEEDGGYYQLAEDMQEEIEKIKDEIEDTKDEISDAEEELEDLRDDLNTEKDILIDKQIALDWHVMYVEANGMTEEEYDGGTTYNFLKGEYDYQKDVVDRKKALVDNKKSEIKTLRATLATLRKTNFSEMKAKISDYKKFCKVTEEDIATIKEKDCYEQAKAYLLSHNEPEITYYVDGYLLEGESVDIGDTVKIINKDTNTNLTANVTSFKYDCIAKKYKSVVFGDIKKISDALNDFGNGAWGNNVNNGYGVPSDITFYPIPEAEEEEGDFLWEYIGSSAKSDYLNLTSIGTNRWYNSREAQYNKHTYIYSNSKLYKINLETKEISVISGLSTYASMSKIYCDENGNILFWGILESANKNNWYARLYDGYINIENEMSASVVVNRYTDNYWSEPFDAFEAEIDNNIYVRRCEGMITKRNFFNFSNVEIINDSFISEITSEDHIYKEEYILDNMETIVNNGRTFLYACYRNTNGKNDVIHCMYEYKDSAGFELVGEYIATSSSEFVNYKNWDSGQILKTDRYIFFTAAILDPSYANKSVMAFDMEKSEWLNCEMPGIDYENINNDNYFTNNGKLYYLYNTNNTDADGNYIIDFWELHR